jgi:hypothetical protein
MCTRSVPSHCLTCLHSESAAESADAVGKGAFASFLRPPVDSGTIGVTVIMDTVVRQSDSNCHAAIQKMRDGTMDDPSCDFFLQRKLSSSSPDQEEMFRSTALYIMPTWK